MHIGYVLKKFPRISETFILNEILELQRQGADVTVFSLHPPNDGLFHPGLAELQRPVVYLPLRKGPALLQELRGRVGALRECRDRLWQPFEDMLLAERSDTWSVLGWGLELAREARLRGVEHLHAHFATVASHVARVAHRASDITFSFTGHAKDLYREGVNPQLFSALVSDAAFTVTVCHANREHILKSLAVGAEHDVLTLYNGVDLETFHPRDRAPDAVPLLLGVGRLVEKKGFHHFIDAAAQLLQQEVPLRAVIVGEGEERPRLEARLAELATPGIELAGMQTQAEVRRLMARAAVLALPCVVGADGNRDALPTVLLEAQAMGLPIVTTPISGNEEITDGGRCGVLVPPGDTDALTAALRELLTDEDRRRALSGAGREHAEQQFDLRRNVGTLLKRFATAGGSR